ncbi:hypothetical protein [Humisphaera borealis]|uniref:Uncharacterized protein n=1 Tax=Humisphaera borealis TaxID=2807512 RepID=A0A7M2X3S7_9BACT|nr:hypothetical protein [Humisphaera borealis]QOV92092.1 hypothetical protein IPV69_12355 [Humisphaera borealis]
MSDRTTTLLDKYTVRRETEPPPATLTDHDGVDDLGDYGWLRGVRERAVCLELRKKSGQILAINYSFIDQMEYDPDKGITLHAAGRKITIRGSGLNAESARGTRLFEGLTRHRVPWVSESDSSSRYRTDAVEVVIEVIEL